MASESLQTKVEGDEVKDGEDAVELDSSEEEVCLSAWRHTDDQPDQLELD